MHAQNVGSIRYQCGLTVRQTDNLDCSNRLLPENEALPREFPQMSCEKFRRCAKVYGLFFLIVLFGC